MTNLVRGNTYRVKHRIRGDFSLQIMNVFDDYCDGIIVKGTAQHDPTIYGAELTNNAHGPREFIQVKFSDCTFELEETSLF